MNKDIILDFIYSIICLLVLFILKYLNKQIKREFTKEKLKFLENGGSINEAMYCFAKINKCNFYISQNTNKMSFKIVGIIDLKNNNISPEKTIIFFDDIFQIKYKTYLLNKINAESKEWIRSIYKK